MRTLFKFIFFGDSSINVIKVYMLEHNEENELRSTKLLNIMLYRMLYFFC